MDILRTPDERFTDLPDWPFAPSYAEVGPPDARVRMREFLERGGQTREVELALGDLVDQVGRPPR